MQMLTKPVSPVSDLDAVHGRLNRLFGEFLGAPVMRSDGALGSAARAVFVPRLDAYETEECFVVTVELAGVDPATLDISISGDRLVVNGEKSMRALPENAKWMHAECGGGTFSRTVAIPTAVDTEAVTAEAANGVLTVRLPKRAEVRPKRIEVKVE